MVWTRKLKDKINRIKSDLVAIYLAYKEKDTPWYAKLAAVLVTAYALSPIDLIPDFIPVLGYLDDFILVPLGISIAIKLIPKHIMKRCRSKAQNLQLNKTREGKIAGLFIIFIWIILVLIIIINI